MQGWPQSLCSQPWLADLLHAGSSDAASTVPRCCPPPAAVHAAGMVGCLCGTPLLLWLPAAALAAYKPFREANMPPPPSAPPSGSAAAEEVPVAEGEVQAAPLPPVLGERGKLAGAALEPAAAPTQAEAAEAAAQAKKED